MEKQPFLSTDSEAEKKVDLKQVKQHIALRALPLCI